MGLLDALRSARGRGSSPPPRLEIAGRRVLLCYAFPALGDALLLGPAVRALLDAGAKPPVGLLLRASAARIWKHVDLPTRVHVLPERLVARPEPDHDEARAEAVRLTVQIRKRGYEVAVDATARDEVDTRRWLRRSEAPIRLGYRIGDHEPEMTWTCPDERVEALEHWTRYVAAPLAPFELGRLPSELPLTTSSSARTKAEQLWGGEGASRVLLVPGARAQDKRFDPQTFMAAGRLASAKGATVVVAGGPAEAGLVKTVAEGAGAAGRYSAKALGPLVALVTGCDVMVCNDTGPMHLAFLSGRRTVAIFTTMSASCWGPMRTDPRFVTLSVPAGAAHAVRPVVERMVLDQLAQHLDALG